MVINPDNQAEEEYNRIINAIGNAAERLYDIMKPGQTLEVILPQADALLIPNQPRKVKRLLITKPNPHIQISLKTKN